MKYSSGYLLQFLHFGRMRLGLFRPEPLWFDRHFISITSLVKGFTGKIIFMASWNHITLRKDPFQHDSELLWFYLLRLESQCKSKQTWRPSINCSSLSDFQIVDHHLSKRIFVWSTASNYYTNTALKHVSWKPSLTTVALYCFVAVIWIWYPYNINLSCYRW